MCADSPGIFGNRVGCAAERSMTVPYIGIVPIRRSAVGIGGVWRGTPGTAFPTGGVVRIRLGFFGIGGVYCGTARGPFPTGELHTQRGEWRPVGRFPLA